MKKISKITLENFRAFSGKREINFNNPDDSYQTNIIFEYETIRGNRHSQRFQANITRHLDRTNFTLFG